VAFFICPQTKGESMRTDDPNYPHKRNPLKFEDVALACATRWCVTEKAALKYLKQTFNDPGEALDKLRQALKDQRSPDEFWASL
jgi:hypothetical protein